MLAPTHLWDSETRPTILSPKCRATHVCLSVSFSDSLPHPASQVKMLCPLAVSPSCGGKTGRPILRSNHLFCRMNRTPAASTHASNSFTTCAFPSSCAPHNRSNPPVLVHRLRLACVSEFLCHDDSRTLFTPSNKWDLCAFSTRETTNKACQSLQFTHSCKRRQRRNLKSDTLCKRVDIASQTGILACVLEGDVSGPQPDRKLMRVESLHLQVTAMWH